MSEIPPLTSALLIAALAAAVIVAAGTRITGVAKVLSRRTGLGEALAGAALLGLVTSLAGAVVSATAASRGLPSLAFSNAVGGIAAQTAFLALADLAHRRANLEHASAEPANLVQCMLLALMLSVPVLAWAGPEATLLGLHPASWALPVIFVLGLRAARRTREDPMWRPVLTEATRREDDGEDAAPAADEASLPVLALRFAGLAVLLGGAGFALSRAAETIIAQTGLAQDVAGALLTAVATSLPELVTTVAAVRRGALGLAVGGIIGGNAFDVLFLTLADGFYRDGSLYHALERADWFWAALGLVMTTVLGLGLLLRDQRGIGFESAAVLALYAGAIAVRIQAG